MSQLVDSGIEWLDFIPSHWTTSKIDALYTLRNEKVSDRDFAPLSVTNKGIVPQLETAAKSDAHDDRKLVRKGDFAINSRSDRRGSCGISPMDGSVSLINTILAPNTEMNPEYYDWLFHTVQFGDEFYKDRIARFLNSRCSEIDDLINSIQTQIEVMEQYKRSVIISITTKGLNNRAELKETGIEYASQIPVTWNMHPLYVYFGERKHKNSLGRENNLLSLSYGKIIQKDINTNEGLLPESFNTYNIIEAGDIIIRPTDLQNDKRSLRTGLAKEHGIITSAYIALMAIKPVNTAYFHYLLHAFDVMKVFYNMGNGVRQGLNFTEFSRLIVFEPPIEEQNLIAEYLDNKCAEIDSIIADKNKQLEILDQYKKSLIYEYVTGKKEVPV